MLSVYSLLKAGLLLLNALAVLHPGRFLRVYGIVESSEDASAKSRLASTLAWSRGLQCASAGRGAARSNAPFALPAATSSHTPHPSPCLRAATPSAPSGCAGPLVFVNLLICLIEVIFG